MSFYDCPNIDLNIQNSRTNGVTLLLPYREYDVAFKKLGIDFLFPKPDDQLALARLPKNWTIHLVEKKNEKTVSLSDGNGILKAKVMYGLFVDVDFY